MDLQVYGIIFIVVLVSLLSLLFIQKFLPRAKTFDEMLAEKKKMREVILGTTAKPVEKKQKPKKQVVKKVSSRWLYENLIWFHSLNYRRKDRPTLTRSNRWRKPAMRRNRKLRVKSSTCRLRLLQFLITRYIFLFQQNLIFFVPSQKFQNL